MKKYFTVITYEGYYAQKALDELEGGDWIVAIEGDFKNISKEEIQKHLEYLEYRKNFINNLLEQVEEIKNEEM